jgi:hypothetical protein
MHITMDWDNSEKTILRMTFADGWTWDDLYVIAPVAASQMRSVEHTVHVLVDNTRTRRLAEGGPSRAVDLMKALPPNLGYVVVVTHNLAVRRVLKSVGYMTGTALGHRLLGVATFEEAYQAIGNFKNRVD